MDRKYLTERQSISNIQLNVTIYILGLTNPLLFMSDLCTLNKKKYIINPILYRFHTNKNSIYCKAISLHIFFVLMNKTCIEILL